MTFTNIMQAPVALDIRSPVDLAYECFVKLGLRYVCVLRDGKYAGMVSNNLKPINVKPISFLGDGILNMAVL